MWGRGGGSRHRRSWSDAARRLPGGGGSSPRSFDCVSTGVAWRATGPWALGAGRARRLPRRAWRRPLTRAGTAAWSACLLGSLEARVPGAGGNSPVLSSNLGGSLGPREPAEPTTAALVERHLGSSCQIPMMDVALGDSHAHRRPPASSTLSLRLKNA